MNDPFVKNVCPSCEFKSWQPEVNKKHLTVCKEDAKRYYSKIGMTIIKRGKKEGKRKVLRLCPEHQAEMKKVVPDLEEVI